MKKERREDTCIYLGISIIQNLGERLAVSNNDQTSE